jgi:hypothetical protein
MTARSLPRLDEDTRLIPILDNLSQGFLAGVPSDWSGSAGEALGDEITAEMVDDMAKKHFPMCMRSLHESLRRDHLLKHFGRLQYGLFLKVLDPASRWGEIFSCTFLRMAGPRFVDRRSCYLLAKIFQQDYG